VRKVGIEAARRIALAAQGFNRPRPAGRVDARHFRRVMSDVGVVQLDSVNVCVRTHYMPFYARLGAYDHGNLDSWLNTSGENFEYWAHAAGVLPVDDYPLWKWKMSEMRPWREAQALLDAHPDVLEDVYRQVRDHGPLTVMDLDAPNHRNEPWWGYGPGKVALEVLFAEGRIAASRTGNFVRLYDLPERMVHPDLVAAPGLAKEDAYRELLRRAIRHQGIGTANDIIDYFRLNLPTARPILAAMAAAGEMEEVEVPGWQGPVYMDHEATRPRSINGTTLLSPFDPIVWYRERALRLFGFDYRIEIYVPEPKRTYGYYVLPLMVDGELVGRTDLKSDRKANRLLVQSAFVEPGADPDLVAGHMAAELERFADWLGHPDVRLGRKGNLMSRVRPRM